MNWLPFVVLVGFVWWALARIGKLEDRVDRLSPEDEEEKR